MIWPSVYADAGAQVLGIGCDGDHGLGRGLGRVVDHGLVLVGNVGDLGRHRCSLLSCGCWLKTERLRTSGSSFGALPPAGGFSSARPKNHIVMIYEYVVCSEWRASQNSIWRASQNSIALKSGSRRRTTPLDGMAHRLQGILLKEGEAVELGEKAEKKVA